MIIGSKPFDPVLQIFSGRVYAYLENKLEEMKEPESVYSKSDQEFISKVRKEYERIFRSAPLPEQLKFRHEMDSKDKIGTQPKDNKFRPPKHLPKEYSRDFKLGKNHLYEYCQTAMSILIVYANGRRDRMWGGGHKSDAISQIINFLLQFLPILSSMNLRDNNTLGEAICYLNFLISIKDLHKSFPKGSYEGGLLTRDETGTFAKTIIEVLDEFIKIKNVIINFQKSNCAKDNADRLASEINVLCSKAFPFLVYGVASFEVGERVTLSSIASVQKCREDQKLHPHHEPFSPHHKNKTILGVCMGSLAYSLWANNPFLDKSSRTAQMPTECRSHTVEEHKDEKYKTGSSGQIDAANSQSSSTLERVSSIPSTALSSRTPAPFLSTELSSTIFIFNAEMKEWVVSPTLQTEKLKSGMHDNFFKDPIFLQNYRKFAAMIQKLGETLKPISRIINVAGMSGSALLFLAFGSHVNAILELINEICQVAKDRLVHLENLAEGEQGRIMKIPKGKRSTQNKTWLENYTQMKQIFCDASGIAESLNLITEACDVLKKDYCDWKAHPVDMLKDMAMDWVGLIVDVNLIMRDTKNLELSGSNYDMDKINNSQTIQGLGMALMGFANIAGPDVRDQFAKLLGPRIVNSISPPGTMQPLSLSCPRPLGVDQKLVTAKNQIMKIILNFVGPIIFGPKFVLDEKIEHLLKELLQGLSIETTEPLWNSEGKLDSKSLDDNGNIYRFQCVIAKSRCKEKSKAEKSKIYQKKVGRLFTGITSKEERAQKDGFGRAIIRPELLENLSTLSVQQLAVMAKPFVVLNLDDADALGQLRTVLDWCNDVSGQSKLAVGNLPLLLTEIRNLLPPQFSSSPQIAPPSDRSPTNSYSQAAAMAPNLVAERKDMKVSEFASRDANTPVISESANRIQPLEVGPEDVLQSRAYRGVLGRGGRVTTPGPTENHEQKVPQREKNCSLLVFLLAGLSIGLFLLLLYLRDSSAKEKENNYSKCLDQIGYFGSSSSCDYLKP